MVDMTDHRAVLALASKDPVKPATIPAEVAAKIGESDPEPAKAPLEASGPAADAAPRVASALEAAA